MQQEKEGFYVLLTLIKRRLQLHNTYVTRHTKLREGDMGGLHSLKFWAVTLDSTCTTIQQTKGGGGAGPLIIGDKDNLKEEGEGGVAEREKPVNGS